MVRNALEKARRDHRVKRLDHLARLQRLPPAGGGRRHARGCSLGRRAGEARAAAVRRRTWSLLFSQASLSCSSPTRTMLNTSLWRRFWLMRDSAKSDESGQHLGQSTKNAERSLAETSISEPISKPNMSALRVSLGRNKFILARH